MSSDPNVLDVEEVRYAVGEVEILKGVSFSLAAGERLALLGANGAGKTTLLRCVLGLLKGSGGSVRLKGEDVGKMSRGELARRVAYVPQLLEASVPFTVRDFVGMGRYAYEAGWFGGDMDGGEVVQECLELVGLEGFSSRVMSSLSGGERQKVCIAAALAQQADLLLLDEPSAHLDPRQRDEVHRILDEVVAERGVAMLAVTHDLNWAVQSFDRVVGMLSGEVVEDGCVGEVMCREKLQGVFGVGFDVLEVGGGQRVVVSARGSERKGEGRE